MAVQNAIILVTLCACMANCLLHSTAEGALAAASVSAQVAVCAECWTKKALGPVDEGETVPHVTCEAVVVRAYWGTLKVTDDVNEPQNLCVAVESPAGALERLGSLKCEVEVERELTHLGRSASVGISYAYNPLNLQEAPKVTLEGKVCPTSLGDLPSAVWKEVRKGTGVAESPVKKEVGNLVKKARGIKDQFKRRFP